MDRRIRENEWQNAFHVNGKKLLKNEKKVLKNPGKQLLWEKFENYSVNECFDYSGQTW